MNKYTDMICIAPQEIQEGDLMAYVYGEADQKVADHIHRCPACQAQVETLRTVETNLLSAYYRTECPPAENLVDYHDGRLQGTEKLIVNAHLKDCPHCVEELAFLAQADQTQTRLERIIEKMGVLIADLMTPQLQPQAVRHGHQPSQQLHQAEGVDVLVDVDPSLLQPGHIDIQGLVLPEDGNPEDAAAIEIWLLQDGDVVQREQINDHGHFFFCSSAVGEYGIAFEWRAQIILLPQVVAG